jgi:hypothetical protein
MAKKRRMLFIKIDKQSLRCFFRPLNVINVHQSFPLEGYKQTKPALTDVLRFFLSESD